MLKNTASQKWIVFAFDRTDNTPKTGDAANITANLRLDGGGADAVDDTNPTELEDGFYIFDITQAETNADYILITPASSTGDIQVIGCPAALWTTETMRGTDSAALATACTEARLARLNADIDSRAPSGEYDTELDANMSTRAPASEYDTEMARITGNVALASVMGALADAAAAGEVTEADTLMKYIKQLINILIGTPGIGTFPAEAAPGNGVSLAKVIRAMHADVTGLNGSAMVGTNGANTTVPDAAGTAPTVAEIKTEIEQAGSSLARILTDTSAQDTATKLRTLMTGADTPVCKDSTPLTAAQVNAQVDTALSDINLDHLMKVAVSNRDTMPEVVDDTVLANIMTKTGGDTSDFDHATDSLEAIKDASSGNITEVMGTALTESNAGDLANNISQFYDVNPTTSKDVNDVGGGAATVPPHFED